MNRQYSKINEIPSGQAADTLIPGCAVLEGGAFRGLYGEGVLDAMMINGVNLSCAIGVSAGAMNGMNYIAGDIGRSARTNLRYRHDSRYVGLTAMRHNHGLIGFDFVLRQLNETDPMNMERFFDPKRRFVAVTTACDTGETIYIERDACSDIFEAIRASASMPYLSRMVKVDGRPYLDGGCSKGIPYEWALKHNYDKIVVIRTRPADFRKEAKESRIARRYYQKYPAFAETLSKARFEYNRECDELQELEKQGRIFVIAPSQPVQVGRVEKNVEKLGALYELGYQDAMAKMDALNRYLEH